MKIEKILNRYSYFVVGFAILVAVMVIAEPIVDSNRQKSLEKEKEFLKKFDSIYGIKNDYSLKLNDSISSVK